MYQLKNVSLSFDKTIFENFSYTFDNQGLYLLQGPSGCGKTTLLRLLFWISLHYEGDILYKGRNIKDFSKIDVDNIREHISYIGVGNNILKNKTGLDNLKCIL